jgi:ABC-type bacteriocin/lantibiotic exporter with double-glycine peptidase domain
LKDLFSKLKWFITQSKPIILYLIFIILLGTLLSITSVYRAIISKSLIDFSIKGNFSSSVHTLIIMSLIILGQITFSSLINLLTSYSSTKLSNNIQKKLYTHITYSKWIDSSKYHTGDILTRITNDVSTITNFIINTIPNVISLTVLLICSFIALLSFEPLLAVLLLLIAPISILTSHFFGRKLKKLYLKSQEAESNNVSFIQESIQNILIVKTFCLEKDNLSNYDKIQNTKLKLSLSRGYISALYNMMISLGYWGSYFLVFCWGSSSLSRGATTFGTLTALLQLTSNIQAPLSGLASSFSQFITSFASVERLMDIENLSLENYKLAPTSSMLENITSAFIEFKNITFGYTKNTTILKNISLNIFSGEIVAIVGTSGEGKTTFIKLLLSLLDDYKGSIHIISNNKIINVSPETRNLISYVPQGNTLFSGSIADNLRNGDPSATENEIESALKSACAWNFITKLQHKTNTIIGERGIGLSEGQAQRIAIARAFLRKKPILILDEATSALDVNTETQILKSIKNLDYSPTCIIITHRPSALSICNRVFRLENGNISEVHDYVVNETASEII